MGGRERGLESKERIDRVVVMERKGRACCEAGRIGWESRR